MANVIDERNRLRIENHFMKTENHLMKKENHHMKTELESLHRELAKSHAALSEISYVVQNSFEQLRTEFSSRGHTRRRSSDGQ